MDVHSQEIQKKEKDLQDQFQTIAPIKINKFKFKK